MDKYEFNIKIEQLKKLVGKNDYETAMKIADTIDWRRVRNTNLLSMVATVYEKNEDYEEAKEILLLAYDRAPIGKRLLYKLAELAIMEGNVKEAEDYYREFVDLAPDDPRQQLLRYLILKEKGAPAQQLIHSLESYTSEELDERWLCELAELYSLAGMPDRCVETCDKIMLMFGLGKYVEKAMELKTLYAPLTTYQMDLVENRDKYEARLRAVEEEYRHGSVGGGQEEAYYDDGQGGYTQAEYAEDGYGQAGYAEDGYGQVGYAEDGYGQAEYAEDGYGQAEYADDGYGQTGYADDGDVQAGYSSNGYQEAGYGQAGYSQDGYGLNGYQEAGYGQAGYSQDGYGLDGYAEDGYGQAGYGAAEYAEVADDQVGYDQAGYAETGSGQTEYAGEDDASDEYTDDSIDIVEPNEALDEAMPYGRGRIRSIDEELKARMQEAEAQEHLAREMSRLNDQELAIEEEPSGMEATRVLEDIRKVRLQGTAKTAAKSSGIAAASAAEASVTAAGAAKTVTAATMTASAAAAAAAKTAASAVAVTAAETTAAAAMPEVTAAPATATTPASAADSAKPVSSRAGRIAPTMPRPHGTVRVTEPAEDIAPKVLAEEDSVLDIEDQEEAEENPVLLNHLMIEARTPEKGLSMAVEALKQIHSETGVKNPVAKITGSKLSKRGVLASAEKLAGKDLVIEEAGDLTKEALDELNDLMNKDTTGMIVVLIDNPKQMEALHLGHPVLASKFECIGCGDAAALPEEHSKPAPARLEQVPESKESMPEAEEPIEEPKEPEFQLEFQPESEPEFQPEPVRASEKKGGFFGRKKPVYEELEPEEPAEDDFYEAPAGRSVRDEAGPGSHGEEMDIDEFAQYACKYAGEIDCSITGKSMLALYERIEILEEDGIPLTRINAEDLIEEAADRAERPSFGKRIKGLFSSKYDKDGLLILKEEHFIY